ncbi:MAG: type II toxin-antitoxin system VapC family toxin [Armatimonadota bacterium]
MNGYLLDTDILIELTKRNREVTHHLIAVQQAGEPVYMHALSYHETKRGLLRANAVKQVEAFERLCRRVPLVNLTLNSLDIAAQIYADLASQGLLIGDADILIAASAIEQNLTLVSRNLRHYERIPNLLVVNWVSAN